MIPEFQTLTDSETELMLKAPILVCILIAGADGDIDRKEIKEAIAIVRKEKKNHTLLSGFFREMAQDFEDKIKILIRIVQKNAPDH
jgi:tellurite resistance protein